MVSIVLKGCEELGKMVCKFDAYKYASGERDHDAPEVFECVEDILKQYLNAAMINRALSWVDGSVNKSPHSFKSLQVSALTHKGEGVLVHLQYKVHEWNWDTGRCSCWKPESEEPESEDPWEGMEELEGGVRTNDDATVLVASCDEFEKLSPVLAEGLSASIMGFSAPHPSELGTADDAEHSGPWTPREVRARKFNVATKGWYFSMKSVFGIAASWPLERVEKAMALVGGDSAWLSFQVVNRPRYNECVHWLVVTGEELVAIVHPANR